MLDSRESSGLENHRPLRDCRFESYTQRQMADWCNGNITVSSAVEDGSTPSSATKKKGGYSWIIAVADGARSDCIFSRKINISVKS